MQRLSVKVSLFIALAALIVILSGMSRQLVQAATHNSDQASAHALEADSSVSQPSKAVSTWDARTSLKVKGKVYNAITGQGLAGASVRYNNCYSHPMVYPTRADGSYEIGWTIYLTCINSFEVSAPGYQTLRQPITYWQLLRSPKRDFYLRPKVTVSPTPTSYVSPTPTLYDLTVTPTPYELTLTPTPTPYEPPLATYTPTPVVSPTDIVPHQAGLLLKGHVRLADGTGVANVKIYRAFASYPGVIVATTDQTGYYQSNFQPIPGDEMVRVWAELPGYTFSPADPTTWTQGAYFWRHYYGYEEKTLGFIAQPFVTPTALPGPTHTPTPSWP